jgi:uncharacterized membrane protein YkvA (DUF1232 family)
MRMPLQTPTAEPLPFRSSHTPNSATTPRLSVPPLHGDAVARFDAFLHEINPDADRVDIDRMQHLLEWLLAMPSADAHDVLDRRLRRIDELRAMLQDPDWDADDAMRARLGKLFAYIDRDDDLIPDHEPLLGLLDDVVLIELAWPVFADEAEEYRDFCAYRNDEHPGGSGGERRTAWLRDRMAELAILEHHVRVSDSHYTYRGHPEGIFRVG